MINRRYSLIVGLSLLILALAGGYYAKNKYFSKTPTPPSAATSQERKMFSMHRLYKDLGMIQKRIDLIRSGIFPSRLADLKQRKAEIEKTKEELNFLKFKIEEFSKMASKGELKQEYIDFLGSIEKRYEEIEQSLNSTDQKIEERIKNPSR